MKIRSLLVGVVMAGVLVMAPLSAASATVPVSSSSHSVVTAKPKPKAYANCTALSKVYKGGVAKAGVKGNKVSGKLKPFKVKPTFSTTLYNLNKKMDRDKDGVACEK